MIARRVGGAQVSRTNPRKAESRAPRPRKCEPGSLISNDKYREINDESLKVAQSRSSSMMDRCGVRQQRSVPGTRSRSRADFVEKFGRRDEQGIALSAIFTSTRTIVSK